MTLRSTVRRHPLIWFAVASIVLSWWAWPFYLLGLLPNPIAAFGPFLAALLILALTEGKSGVVGLFRRMGRWRVGAGWYLTALALPIVLTGVAVVINQAMGAPVDLTTVDIDWLGLASTFATVLLIPGVGGAWEEPGWRGYAVPRLQSRRTALRAALILGVLVAFWHLPLIVVGQVIWTDVIQIMGAIILFNWLFNNAGGSVLIIMLAHAMNNTVWSTLTSKVVTEPYFFRQAGLQAVVWCLAAAAVVLVTGPTHLSRRHPKQEEALPARPSDHDLRHRRAAPDRLPATGAKRRPGELR